MKDYLLSEEELRAVRAVVIVGLGAYGEIERLIDVAKGREICGRPVDSDLRPLHPTGSPTTTSDFAYALTVLNGGREAP